MFDLTEKRRKLKEDLVYYDRNKKSFYTLEYIDGADPKKHYIEIGVNKN